MKPKGILLVNKEQGSTSFQIVAQLRKLTAEQTIGHAGTLDPFATGVMILLIGREYTRRSDEFLTSDKSYRAIAKLGISTDSHDVDGKPIEHSDFIPPLEQVLQAISQFQGNILQIPPMYSAKKIQGQKLCDLARRGIVLERQPVKITVQIEFISYAYPYLEFSVHCSKGTYIRTLAHDIGKFLGCGAHLTELTREKSGTFTIGECIPQSLLKTPGFNITPHLRN